MAIGLRKYSFHVDIYEKGEDIRRIPPAKGHSFNLTLTARGLRSLDTGIVDLLYRRGVPLPQRVVHHRDGGLIYQRYGTAPEHHLLSIPRGVLHRALLEEAARAGAHFHFGHECIGADPKNATATFAVRGSAIEEVAADLLIGCDGANSVVRAEMSRRGARMRISQEYIDHGYIELQMPPRGGGHALLQAFRDPTRPESGEHGLHVWPRGEFMLLAQPNVDLSYTASLFMPLQSADGAPAFSSVHDTVGVEALFGENFADAVQFLPSLADDFLTTTPASLKTVKCHPYHYGRTVLIGDAAHAMVPFYGQGINCSFEDVREFLRILEQRMRIGGAAGVAPALASFTELRKAPGDAIADLSLRNLRELTDQTGEHAYHARDRLDKRLFTERPDDFMPLYHMVAFTDLPYDEVVRRHERQSAVVDDLCRHFDIDTEADRIVGAYPGAAGADIPVLPDGSEDSELELRPEEVRRLLDTVALRVLRYRDALNRGEYPASYLQESTAADYQDGRTAADALREDTAPARGTDLEPLLAEVFDEAATSGMVHPHPGFMSHVPSGGLFQGAVGEFVSRLLNRFIGVWAATPGLTQIETNVIRWFCSMLGYGEGSFGYLTTGGSIANFMGVRCALEAMTEDGRSRATVYVSAQGHFSVKKAARMAGIPEDRVRAVATRPDYTMDLGELRRLVEHDRHRGLAPACVVATAGTTGTGAVDDLAAIARLCAAEQIWMHADACFGGFFRLTSRGRELLHGIEEADSIAVDAHKSLFLPHGTSALLVREQARLREAFAVPGAAYIPELTSDDDHVDFCNYGPELTREMRGLTAWLPIKLHGVDAFERSLDHKLDLADELTARLRSLPGIEVLPRGPAHLPVVAFRAAADGPRGARLTERLCRRICATGDVYVATTELPGEGLVVRACIMHHRTSRAVVARLVDAVRWAAADMTEETPEEDVAHVADPAVDKPAARTRRGPGRAA
ncbi:glutamate/tyrosine decarboxylase-like PLP-dependent enzyme/2-polyprenyl-6-methoxyphenol hydroxylase-like FAD-dependent oxidoreductase [Nocardiopsis mwathae]|uniref:Glutamate/tyrosine decarboxylase-like PLP-dependent enzyme/2-polyprenyl-6-methoxyphenol hydroxylase-like FAD-dependent oxidoreductase n=1 Tax=Nocardiopsis mwathae TaxID=1472723 RepID=A0A7W9YM68_9ACTN|nr:glutamate/tyrosine decarboxylase-like PLP-dependent enzyme/2-polyprenyl-6-methoxyphenol hydroxylase-like FAD-dependent oxidoreductase [Nocardiopsis mwathae]